jgi:hypothetical protein
MDAPMTTETETHETTAAQAPASPEVSAARKTAFDTHFASILGAPAVGGATLDAGYGAERALELVAVARRPDVADDLALLPDALFARDEVTRLEALAHATLYADQLAARQSASEDKVGDALLEEADQVRATLHKLLDYHFGDDTVVAAELQELRARRGAFRVAATLARLAALARERSETLMKDAKYWRDGLIAEAERLARVVQAQIGAISEKDATELKRKAYGLLDASFNEVKTAIVFVTRRRAASIEPLPQLKRPAIRKARADNSPAGG